MNIFYAEHWSVNLITGYDLFIIRQFGSTCNTLYAIACSNSDHWIFTISLACLIIRDLTSSPCVWPLQEVARQYLDYLLSEENFEEAAMQCPRILGKNKELWEAETLKFHKLRQLKVCVFLCWGGIMLHYTCLFYIIVIRCVQSCGFVFWN